MTEGVSDTIPAPADRPTNPGDPPDPAAGPLIDLADRVFTQLTVLKATQDSWGKQIVDQLREMVAETKSVTKQLDLVTEELVSLRKDTNQLAARMRKLEARVELLEHGHSNGNGSLPPEQ